MKLKNIIILSILNSALITSVTFSINQPQPCVTKDGRYICNILTQSSDVTFKLQRNSSIPSKDAFPSQTADKNLQVQYQLAYPTRGDKTFTITYEAYQGETDLKQKCDYQFIPQPDSQKGYFPPYGYKINLLVLRRRIVIMIPVYSL